MDMISVECPSCGADLPPQQPCGSYQCDYCGSRFQLDQARKAKTQAGAAVDPKAIAQAILAAQQEQARARQAQAQADLAQAQADAARAQARAAKQASRSGRGLGCLITSIVLFTVIGSLVPVFFVVIDSLEEAGFDVGGDKLREGLNAIGGDVGSALTGERILWDDVAGPPVAATIDGQTVVVGRTRAVGTGDSLYCSVHDVDGSLRWRTESLGDYSSAYQSSFCGVLGDAMIVTDGVGTLRVFALASGEQLHQHSLTDVVDYLCVPPKSVVEAPVSGEPAQVWVHQIDERASFLDPETGELTEAKERPQWCFRSRHDAFTAASGGGDWSDAIREGRRDPRNPRKKLASPFPEVEGAKLEFLAVDGDQAVALGHKAPGTKVPYAVAFDPNTKEIRWQAATPSVPKTTVRDEEKFGVIANGRYVTTYGAGNEDWRITAFDLQGGERVWETTLRPIFAVDSLNGLVSGGTHVFLVRTSSLEIFDVATGQLTGTVGVETYD